jgi:hypothetical protein
VQRAFPLQDPGWSGRHPNGRRPGGSAGGRHTRRVADGRERSERHVTLAREVGDVVPLEENMNDIDETRRREDRGKRIAVVIGLIALVIFGIMWFSRY